MGKMLFINLPVTDLAASTRFYEALGATKNPQFSNENAACMMLCDTIGVMILTHGYYGSFTKRPIADAKATSQRISPENRAVRSHSRRAASLPRRG